MAIDLAGDIDGVISSQLKHASPVVRYWLWQVVTLKLSSTRSGAIAMSNNPFGPWATALSPVNRAKLSTFWVRRLTMLPNLGQSIPILSRRSRSGLIALAMIALGNR